MVKFFIFSVVFISGFCFSQIKSLTFPDWEIQKKKEAKPTIIHIYTDWCTVCKIESFQLSKDKELIRIISEHFYFVNFEAEKTKGKINFQGKVFNYLPNGNSGIHEFVLALSKNKNQPVYPLWIILDKDQNLVYYQEGLFKPQKMKDKLLEITGK